MKAQGSAMTKGSERACEAAADEFVAAAEAEAEAEAHTTKRKPGPPASRPAGKIEPTVQVKEPVLAKP
jgi:hypothetical protein